MLQLIEFFLSQNWRVNFGTTAQKNPNSIDLSEIGVQEYSLELNSSSFDNLIQKINPTIVLFDRFMTEEQFGWRVAENCPKAFRVLDTEDLHCLRKTRQKGLKDNISFSPELLLNSEVAKREIASIYRSDISLIISAYEMRLLQEVFKIPEDLLFYLPFLLEKIDRQKQELWPKFEERINFVSIGNFLHAPNVDATIQLKQVIWNKIRKKLPNAELHIYGAYPTQQVLEFTNSREGFYVHGYIKDVNQVLTNARVLLAPLRFGAGIKGKLTDAMLCGTSSITTSIGAEGMDCGMPWNGFVEDNFDEFVNKAVKLYSDKTLWEKAQHFGIEIINNHYDKRELEPDFFNKIQIVFDQLEKHRNTNFIGKILMHHTMQSTKYLSKWIEEKNRNN